MPIPIQEGWELNPETCPPDLHFIEYLEHQLYLPHPCSIFHMGCGLHHSVGLWAAKYKDIYVKALSITPAEIDRYMELATANPYLNSRYHVEFGDIHLLEDEFLTFYDYVTFFHLGEITEPYKDGHTIPQILEMFTGNLFSESKIFFFEQSAAWKNVENEVDKFLVKKGWYFNIYKSLRIYKKAS